MKGQVSAAATYKTVTRYLLSRGWYQDGDDPASWRRNAPGGEIWPDGESGTDIGSALTWQLVHDNVDQSNLVKERT